VKETAVTKHILDNTTHHPQICQNHHPVSATHAPSTQYSTLSLHTQNYAVTRITMELKGFN